MLPTLKPTKLAEKFNFFQVCRKHTDNRFRCFCCVLQLAIRGPYCIATRLFCLSKV
jgi:hypothetical protein